MIDRIYEHFVRGFEEAAASQASGERRIGAELKFPLVNPDGTAAGPQKVEALWAHLASRGWRPVVDESTGRTIGARRPGEQNDTLASCETGYCKPEFSLAHVSNLFDLEASVAALRAQLAPFCEKARVRFLGCGIQPVTPPSARLLMRGKSRTSVWDRVFGANRVLPPEDGDDVCLFTVNAASHVHVSVTRHDAIGAVNVLNGFAGPQIALTANSNVWRGHVEPHYKCVAERLWDWWMPETDRVGVPRRPFRDLKDYVETIAGFRPVYVKRPGGPIVLHCYDSFRQYFASARAVGERLDGKVVSFVPRDEDIDLHNTCYWFNARLSRYYTVENRANDQQPPEDLLCVAALTLGLVSALVESWAKLSTYDWLDLRQARKAACRDGLSGLAGEVDLAELAGQMLALAQMGLERRGLGEEKFLGPLWRRLGDLRCPADKAAELCDEEGMAALVEARSL
jgi:gamma-glutamylcysteine synthetase